MKRHWTSWFFFIVLALVVVALFSYWLRYGLKGDVKFKLPSQATALINIDLRKIEHTVFWDAIYHPMAYWDGWGSKTKDDPETSSDGIAIPKQVVLFLMEGHDDILFSQPISCKPTKFREYADTLIQRNEWDAIDTQCVFDAQKKLFYVWDDERLGVAFAKRNQEKFVRSTIGDLLSDKACTSISDDFSEKIYHGDHHFSIWRKQTEWTNNEPVFLYGDFEKGGAVIRGEVPVRFVFSEINPMHENLDTDVLGFSLNMNLPKNQFQFSNAFTQAFQKATHLELDSILQYSTGAFSLKVPSVETKTDSIVTYEYDDDFNKVETVSTQEISTPVISAQLNGRKSQLLLDYFSRRGVVKEINGSSRFVGLPLVEMQAISKGKNLVLTSGDVVLNTKNDSSFFSLDVGCSQYPQMFNYLPFQLDSVQVELIKGVEIKVSQVPNTDKISLMTKINIKNKNRNILGVLASRK